MKITIPLIAILMICGCSREGEQEAQRQQAPVQLSKWSWLPSSDAHAPEVARIPEGADVAYSIPEDAPLETHSEAPGGIDTYGNFVPKAKKSIVVDAGALESELGPIKKTATWGDWDEVWTDASRTARAGWGYSLTGGEILLPRSVFENPPADRYAQNVFEIEAFGDNHVLVRLDPAKGHRLCFLETGRAKVPTAGYIGSKAEVNGKVLERKTDGWYSGATRISN